MGITWNAYIWCIQWPDRAGRVGGGWVERFNTTVLQSCSLLSYEYQQVTATSTLGRTRISESSGHPSAYRLLASYFLCLAFWTYILLLRSHVGGSYHTTSRCCCWPLYFHWLSNSGKFEFESRRLGNPWFCATTRNTGTSKNRLKPQSVRCGSHCSKQKSPALVWLACHGRVWLIGCFLFFFLPPFIMWVIFARYDRKTLDGKK